MAPAKYIVGQIPITAVDGQKKEGDIITYPEPLSSEKLMKLGLTPCEGTIVPDADEDKKKEPLMTIKELTEHVAKMDDRVEINLLKKDETRKGAIEAIAARIKELEEKE